MTRSNRRLAVAERPNPWRAPEASRLLGRHIGELLRAGIFESYLAQADNTYDSPTVPEQQAISSIARAEYALGIIANKGMFSGEPEAAEYFLTKVDADGLIVRSSDPVVESATVFVAEINGGGVITDISEHFNDKQIAVITRQAKELEQIGLHPRYSRKYY